MSSLRRIAVAKFSVQRRFFCRLGFFEMISLSMIADITSLRNFWSKGAVPGPDNYRSRQKKRSALLDVTGPVKSTLFNLLNGIDKDFSGEIKFRKKF